MASTEEDPNGEMAAAAAAAAGAPELMEGGGAATTHGGLLIDDGLLTAEQEPSQLQQAGQQFDPVEQQAALTTEQQSPPQQLSQQQQVAPGAAPLLGFYGSPTSTAAAAAERAVVAAASAPPPPPPPPALLLETNPVPPAEQQEAVAAAEQTASEASSLFSNQKDAESITPAAAAAAAATTAQETTANAIAVWTPLEHDVLSGRGALVNAHPGNRHFRALCFARKPLFDHANHAAKKRICAEIWRECVQKYGSRYLKKKKQPPPPQDGDDKSAAAAATPWYEQPASVAELKAAQVMRDYKRPDRLMQREIMAAKGKQRIRTTATPLLDGVPVEAVPPQPLVECPEGVTANDILAGRGAFVNGHPGNQRLRQLAAERKEAFDNANYSDKRALADEIVAIIQSLDPPGRFLTKNSNGNWAEISHQKCIHKASQTMRDLDRADRKEREERRRLRKERKQAKMAEMMAAAATAASLPQAPVAALNHTAVAVETQNPPEEGDMGMV